MLHRSWAGMTGLSLVACALCAGSAWAEIVIETVPVGNVGNAVDTATHSGNPAGQGQVNYKYGIGKYEVTAGQYTAFLNAVAATDTYGLYDPVMWSNKYGCKIQQSGSSGSYTYSVAVDYANRPVNCVSFGDAIRFANWLHNGQPTGAQNASTTEDGAYFIDGAYMNAELSVTRKAAWKWAVTSEDEWYKAAYYNPASGTYYLYPTSNDSAPGRDMADVSGNNANQRSGVEPYPIDSPYYSTPGGQFQNSASPYGTFDQGGNVWEWNETNFAGSARGVRGGSFGSADTALQSDVRTIYDTMNQGYEIGFRVSQVPEPVSVGLLALGLTGMLMRRRDGGR